MEIAEKKVVKLHYKGTLKDGSVFDTSEGREPLEFMFGVGMLIPGLEKGILGLKAGDKKTVDVPSAEAYGEKNDAAVQEVPKEHFPKEIELKEGMQLMAQGPQGPIPVKVDTIKEESVIVDFNHPLAGKDLTFEVEILEVREATEQELSHGHAHPGGADHPHEQEAAAQASQEPAKEESLEEALETEDKKEESSEDEAKKE